MKKMLNNKSSLSMEEFSKDYHLAREAIINRCEGSLESSPLLRLVLDLNNAHCPSDLLNGETNDRVLVPGTQGGVTPPFLYHAIAVPCTSQHGYRVPNWSDPFYRDSYLSLFMPSKCAHLNPTVLAENRRTAYQLSHNTVFNFKWMPPQEIAAALKECIEHGSINDISIPSIPPFLLHISVFESFNPSHSFVKVPPCWLIKPQSNQFTIAFVNPSRNRYLQMPESRKAFRQLFLLGLGVRVRSSPVVEFSAKQSGVFNTVVFYQQALATRYMKCTASAKVSEDLVHLFKQVNKQAEVFDLPDPVDSSYLPQLLNKLGLDYGHITKQETMMDIMKVIQDLPNAMLVGDITEWTLTLIKIKETVKLSTFWDMLEDEIQLPPLCNREDLLTLRKSAMLHRFSVATQASQSCSGNASLDGDPLWMADNLSTILMGLIVGTRVITWDTWEKPLISVDRHQTATCESPLKHNLLELVPVVRDGLIRFKVATSDHFNVVLTMLLKHHRRWYDRGVVANTLRFMSASSVLDDPYGMPDPISVRFKTNQSPKMRLIVYEQQTIQEGRPDSNTFTMQGLSRWHDGILLMVVLLVSHADLGDLLLKILSDQSLLADMSEFDDCSHDLIAFIIRSLHGLVQKNRNVLDNLHEVICHRRKSSGSRVVELTICADTTEMDYWTNESLIRQGWKTAFDPIRHAELTIRLFRSLVCGRGAVTSDVRNTVHWLNAVVWAAVVKRIEPIADENTPWTIMFRSTTEPERKHLTFHASDFQASGEMNSDSGDLLIDDCAKAEFLLHHTLHRDRETCGANAGRQANFSSSAISEMDEISQELDLCGFHIPLWLKSDY
eukprot:GHVH01000302.1.p1 GENE.GHVH01000302.1~~GHVH01000302.1.p1  ORF type:complete len:836 (+),score=86.94 GHVH01000302.1:421-2928(+)